MCAFALNGQHPRVGWKLKPFDLDARLSHSLADAPLTNDEREQIYDAVAPGDNAREMVMNSRVGSIALALNGSEQIVMKGTKDFCGATGNCTIWIFVRENSVLRVALKSIGNRLTVLKTSSRGLRDVVIGQHYSGFVEEYHDYRWDGSEYKQADCYRTVHPVSSDFSGPPVIDGCR